MTRLVCWCVQTNAVWLSYLAETLAASCTALKAADKRALRAFRQVHPSSSARHARRLKPHCDRPVSLCRAPSAGACGQARGRGPTLRHQVLMLCLLQAARPGVQQLLRADRGRVPGTPAAHGVMACAEGW